MLQLYDRTPPHSSLLMSLAYPFSLSLFSSLSPSLSFFLPVSLSLYLLISPVLPQRHPEH